MLGVAFAAALVFWVIAAFSYLRLDQASFGFPEAGLWPRRYGLLAHIAGGTLAMFIGPVQIWLGETRTRLTWHRTLGTLYLAGVALGAAGGILSALSVTPMFMIVFIGALEMLVAFLQAYVFAILTCIYLNEALHLHEHH